MKHGAVVPDVRRFPRPISGHIGFDPVHSIRVRANPCSCSLEGSARHIENADAIKTLGNEVIDQARVPRADVEHSTAFGEAG